MICPLSSAAAASASTAAAAAAATDFSADSESLPSMVCGLIQQLSEECVRADGLVTCTEQKVALQEMLRQNARERSRMQMQRSEPAEPPSPPREDSHKSAASYSLHVEPPDEHKMPFVFDCPPSLSFASMPAFALAPPTLSFASVPPFAAAAHTPPSSSSSMLDPPIPGPSTLLRNLSDAARMGLISPELKEELKNMLLTPSSGLGVLSRTRLVRHTSEEGEIFSTRVRIDLSHCDEALAAEWQSEERHALQAIYSSDAVQFEVSNEDMDASSRRPSVDEREGDELEECEDDEDDEDDGVQQQQCCALTLRITPFPSHGASRNMVGVILRFVLPPLYPFVRPSFHIESTEGSMTDRDGLMVGSMVNEKINDLFSVEPRADDARVVLFDLIQVAQGFLVEFQDYLEDSAYHQHREDAARQAVQAAADELAIAEESVRHAQAYLAFHNHQPQVGSWSHFPTHAGMTAEEKERLLEKTEAARKLAEAAQKKAEEARLAAEAALKEKLAKQEALRAEFAALAASAANPNPTFADVRPSHEDVLSHIGKTDRCIAAHNLKAFQTGHAFFEEIASPFLIYRFLKKRQAMAAAGRPTEISIGFHGTQPHNVQSIAAGGLVMPGEAISETGVVLQHRFGQGSYGKGIYLSPFISTSLSYGSFGNIFVCLALRGLPFTTPMKVGCSLEPGFDSHLSASLCEWVLFDAAAVLPLYLVKGSAPAPPQPTASTPPRPPPQISDNTYRRVAGRHACKPPLSSLSARLLLAQIQREAAESKVKSCGPVSSKPRPKKAKKQVRKLDTPVQRFCLLR